MSDRPHSTPQPPLDSSNWHRYVCREVVYIGGLLKLTADRLELLADALPLPDRETVQRVLEASSEREYAEQPALSLHVDLETLASHLKDVAARLEESAETNLPDDDEITVDEAARLSEESLREVWDNPDDAEYDDTAEGGDDD